MILMACSSVTLDPWPTIHVWHPGAANMVAMMNTMLMSEKLVRTNKKRPMKNPLWKKPRRPRTISVPPFAK